MAERDRISLAAIAALALALSAGLGALAWILWHGLDARAAFSDRAPPALLPQAEDSLWMMHPFRGTPGDPFPPLLQTDARRDRAVFRAREDSLLNGYGWADSAKGLMRVPVATAMARLAEQGTALRWSPDSEPGAWSEADREPIASGFGGTDP